MADRRYSDRDVALILKRAVELEDQNIAEVRSGISLSELQEIAAEVGIDPTMVRHAADELERRGTLERRLLEPRVVSEGAARVRDLRSVPVSLDDAERRSLLWAVSRAYPEQGTVTEGADGVRWTSRLPTRSAQVTVRGQGEETLIAVEESLAGTRGPILGFSTTGCGVVGLALGASGGDAPTVLMLGLIFAIAGFFLGGGIWQLVLDRSIRRVRLLSDELVRLARAPRTQRPSAG